MTLIDWIIIGIALLVVWLGHVNLIVAALAAVVAIVVVKVIQGARIP